MAIKFFAKTRNPQGFVYKPRYYDEAKESLDERIGKYKNSGNEPKAIDRVHSAKDRIRGTFRNKQKGVFRTEHSKENRQSNIRLLQIIVILTIIAYLILRSDFILRFIQKISG
jgi:hypothetical protein